MTLSGELDFEKGIAMETNTGRPTASSEKEITREDLWKKRQNVINQGISRNRRQAQLHAFMAANEEDPAKKSEIERKRALYQERLQGYERDRKELYSGLGRGTITEQSGLNGRPAETTASEISLGGIGRSRNSDSMLAHSHLGNVDDFAYSQSGHTQINSSEDSTHGHYPPAGADIRNSISHAIGIDSQIEASSEIGTLPAPWSEWDLGQFNWNGGWHMYQGTDEISYPGIFEGDVINDNAPPTESTPSIGQLWLNHGNVAAASISGNLNQQAMNDAGGGRLGSVLQGTVGNNGLAERERQIRERELALNVREARLLHREALIAEREQRLEMMEQERLTYYEQKAAKNGAKATELRARLHASSLGALPSAHQAGLSRIKRKDTTSDELNTSEPSYKHRRLNQGRLLPGHSEVSVAMTRENFGTVPPSTESGIEAQLTLQPPARLSPRRMDREGDEGISI